MEVLELSASQSAAGAYPVVPSEARCNCPLVAGLCSTQGALRRTCSRLDSTPRCPLRSLLLLLNDGESVLSLQTGRKAASFCPPVCETTRKPLAITIGVQPPMQPQGYEAWSLLDEHVRLTLLTYVVYEQCELIHGAPRTVRPHRCRASHLESILRDGRWRASSLKHLT